MKKTMSVLGLGFAMCFAAMGEDLMITSFPGNGVLTWEYPTNGVTSYRVEWAPQADGPYANFAGAAALLDAMAPTGATMAAAVPMFYRVVATATNPPAPAGDYMVIDLSAGPDASSYPVSYLTAVPEGGWSDDYKTTKLVLRLIPATAVAFAMGSPTNELGRGTDETQHAVTLTQPFYAGVFEVTQKQWERVVGTWPSYFANDSYRDSRPVEQVSYNDIRGASAGTNWPADNNVDADSFMGRLRARTGEAFDLPTESQWEYAGRAGTTTALNSGYNLASTDSDARMSEVGRYAYNGGSEATPTGDTSVATAKVGSYLANAWGLHDMHGNVWEWCLDWYGTYPGTVSDPNGEVSGSNRVDRGGSWNDSAFNCRSAYRSFAHAGYAIPALGFRAVAPSPGR